MSAPKPRRRYRAKSAGTIADLDALSRRRALTREESDRLWRAILADKKRERLHGLKCEKTARRASRIENTGA